MTVEPSWRYEGPVTLDDGVIPDFDDTGAEVGQWVPDTRLQAIADAWNALNAVTDIYGPEADMLGDLLDALTEENNDGEAFGYERPGSDEVADPR